MSMEDRANLALEVYKSCFDYFESFKGNVGTQLTYLLGAILDGEIFDLNCSFKEHRQMYSHLQSIFDSKHPVWMHINLEF